MLKTTFESKIALGCVCNLVIVTDDQKIDGQILLNKLWLELLLFEKRFSRFLPDSELSRFNKSAGLKSQISPEFRAFLLATKSQAEQTDGLFNPFILPALQRAGYVKSMVRAYAINPVDDFSGCKVVDAAHLKIGENWAEIPYGTAIDSGGCGKGYAADVLADVADSYGGVVGYWFSLGGDVIARGRDEDGRAWQIEIEDTNSENEFAARVKVPKNGRLAVATSSVKFRGGKGWHHIIDPRTGKPSNSDVVSATVCASRAIDADVLASCLIILGSKPAKPFMRGRSGFQALLQTRGNSNKGRMKLGGRLIKEYAK